MSDNEKRSEWEAKGRWGTKKEFLARKRWTRTGEPYLLAMQAEDLINKIEEEKNALRSKEQDQEEAQA